MFRPLIFGGTAEGRRLAEYCSERSIRADVSVATEYGVKFLPENAGVLCGRLGSDEISELLHRNNYSDVIDATHPYAENATVNIKKACERCGTPYYRLLRESSEISGETAENISEIVTALNSCDLTVLSTLGSNSAKELTAVNNFYDRIWLRVLPSDAIKKELAALGYDEKKIISENGPFDLERNISHIKMSRAKILLTKESGITGGFPEKKEAAEKCGIRMITLVRPAETGYSYNEIISIIERKSSEK